MSVTKLAELLSSQRIDARPLAAARLVAGVAALCMAFEAWRMLSRLLMPLIVRMPLIPSVPLLPRGMLMPFIAVWVAAALAFALGWRTRFAGTVLTLVTGYTLIMDEQTYSNHLYLLVVVIFLLTIAGSGAAWSVDARRDGVLHEVAAWPALLLKIQITIVYFFAAVAKITPSYLAGEILDRSLKQEGWLVMPQSWRTPEVLSALAVISIALELFIAFGLWSRRVRWIAIVAGVMFHLFILLAVSSSRLSLGIFALTMFAGYVVFAGTGSRSLRWRVAAQET